MFFGQVNKLFSSKLLRNIPRCYHHSLHNIDPSTKVLFPLKHRQLLKISGDDVPEYLQGLVTNDMRHFEDGAVALYAMFLNNKGRVLFETNIYKYHNKSFLIECDKNITPALQKHLLMFKLRRKIELENVNQFLNLWGLLSEDTLEGEYADEHDPLTDDSKCSVAVFKDPRLSDLGYRVVASSNLSGKEVANSIMSTIKVHDNADYYKYLRYKSGVAEGSDEIPPGLCFPFELNCDFLKGVSFHKGCYVGQELTARVHHTGVVRKRIIPLKFNDIIDEKGFSKDEPITIVSNPKISIGKLKGITGDHGLGLVRIKEALEHKELSIKDHVVQAVKPPWWPELSQTEKLIS